MSDWQFNNGEVLTDTDGHWWHVLHRRQCVDCEERRYELADATHTEYKELHADDVEGAIGVQLFESDGWTADMKPASVHGFRVNGTLCGPQETDRYKGKACLHDRECPECGCDGRDEIDVIHSIESKQVTVTTCECRVCKHSWTVDNE